MIFLDTEKFTIEKVIKNIPVFNKIDFCKRNLLEKLKQESSYNWRGRNYRI